MKTLTTLHANALLTIAYYREGEYSGNVTLPASAHAPEHAALRQAALDWYVGQAAPGETVVGDVVIGIYRDAAIATPGDPEAEPPVEPTYRHVLIGSAPVRNAAGQARQLSRSSEDMPPELRDGFLTLVSAVESLIQ